MTRGAGDMRKRLLEPALSLGPVEVYLGDVREVLAQLPAESVQVVVTSPPYWGLRDYGTATWDGGEPDCDHSPERRGGRFATPVSSKQASNTGSGTASRAACPCGATRVDSQLGLEATPDEYVANMIAVFREVRRVLRKDGTLWLNLGDSYAGSGKGPSNNSEMDRPYRGMSNVAAAPNRWLSIPTGIKSKDLIGVPWRVAFALQADGWYLRSDIIWAKPNPMPESVTDRPTKAHEYLFLLTKSPRYFYDADAIREASEATGPTWPERRARGEPMRHGLDGAAAFAVGGFASGVGGRNKRSVWTIATQPYPEAHFATYPEELVIPCIKAGSREGDLVLDPFAGSGTTLAVARRLGRRAIGIELNAAYLPLIETRVNEAALPLLEALTSWGPAQPAFEAAAAANAGETESSPAPRREVSA